MKKLKKLFISLALSAAMIIPAAFPQQGSLSVVSAATIKINTKFCTIVKGKSKTLFILGTKKKVTWKSSKSSIATVSSKGRVTAKKAGTTTITATVNKKKYTCKVTVKNPIKINITSCTIVKGSSKTLSILGTTQKVTWKSSKSSVATVSSKGKVTAKKAGTTTITATVNKMKYTCKVTVKNPNKYIATAPYKAVERTVGDINFVVPKDWTFENMQEISGTSVAVLFPKSTENSNVILTCEKTGTDALDFASLKEAMDGSYNAEIIKQTFSSVFGTEDIVVQDFTSGEFKTKYGSAYKAAYTLIIPKGIQLDELNISLDVDNIPDTTTTEPITLKQAIYTIYMDNYSITVVSTDMDNKNIEAVTDYVMKTFTLDK